MTPNEFLALADLLIGNQAEKDETMRAESQSQSICFMRRV